MENSASAVVGQQQHEAAQQKSKKKPKNRKHNNGKSTQSVSNGQADGEVVHTPPTEHQVLKKKDDVTVTNGLTEEVKQKLHIESIEKMCKVNGVLETATAAAITTHEAHHTRTATQNGHHHTILSQQSNHDDDDHSDHHHHPHQQQQKQQLQNHHHEPFNEQTNGADVLPSTANKHNKKSKNSKSNKSKNKLNDDDDEVQQQQKQHTQEQLCNTQPPAHTTASNGTSVGMDQVSDKEENGFSSSSSSTSNSSGITVDGKKQTHNTNEKEVANLADVTHTKANQLSAHPAAATSVSAIDAATSSNTANKDSTAPTITATNTNETIIAATASVAASNPAQTTNITNNIKETGDAVVESPTLDLSNVHIEYKEYESELQLHDIMRLIHAELSEPYSIYTYRYFIYNWPKLCFLAAHGNEYVGAIVCKLDMHMNVRRGYIAMLAVRKEYRKLKIGTTLVQKAIEAMLADNADEVVLETEMRNVPALRLYENLGFVRDKRLFRYYLNGVDALRLKLWFR